MNEAAIKKQIINLSTLLTSMKVPSRNKPAEGEYIPTPKDEVSAEESMETLELQIKYLVFDLEATRRENRYLAQMLERRPRSGEDDRSKE